MIVDSKAGRSRGFTAVLFIIAFFLMVFGIRLCTVVAVQHAPVSPEVNQIVNEYTRKTTALSADYVKSLEHIGWYAILDPIRLSGDIGFGESRRIIAAARESLDDHKSRGDEIIRAYAESVDDLDIPSLKTTNFLKQLSSNREMTSNARSESLGLESQIMTEVERIIDLFDNQPPVFTVAQGVLQFSSDEVASEYKSRLDNIERLLLEQEQIAENLAEAQLPN
jgi:hypothetical protein